MLSADIAANGITCVADMSAAPNVIWMQDIESNDFIIFGIYGNAGVSLLFKKLISGFGGQSFFLRESETVFYNLIPYFSSFCSILCLI